MSNMRVAGPITKGSIVDGQGMRMVIWSQGCMLKCPGCHNPETHPIWKGRNMDTTTIKRSIKKNLEGHQGITLSGGDPFLQPRENKELADYAHTLGLDVWVYCGKTFEELIKSPEAMELLESCDVLVDGPYIEKQRDVTLAFRGSKNQRIIKIPESLEKGEVVLWTD